MVFSIKSEIHGVYLSSEIYYPITRNLQHAVAVSLDANYIYWSDIENGNEAIIKSSVDGTQREIIVTTGKIQINSTLYFYYIQLHTLLKFTLL